MNINIMLYKGALPPVQGSGGAACYDCFSNLADDIVIQSGDRALVPLGFAVELPKEYEMVIRPRSGFSKRGIDVAIGTIDCDYRGEVSACVINNTKEPLTISHRQRICQAAVRHAPDIDFKAVTRLSSTDRGDKGFGSTGID